MEFACTKYLMIMKRTALILNIEFQNDLFFGRVNYNDNLIVDSAKYVPLLEEKLKELLHVFEGLEVDEISFEIVYD